MTKTASILNVFRASRMLFTAKPVSNVTLVTAVLPSPVSVNVKLLTAVLAGKCVVCLSLYEAKMTVPPLGSALIAAEAFLLPLDRLLKFFPAVLTKGGFGNQRFSILFCRFSIDVVPDTERLHRANGDPQFAGNRPVAFPVSP